MYDLEVEDALDKGFFKLARRSPVVYEALRKKVLDLRESPYHCKPLRAPLQGKRRAHVGSFVLLYTIDERRKTVRLLAFEHHDNAYKQ